MENHFKKSLSDIILASFILSIFYYVPFVGSLFWVHLIINGFFLLFSMYVFLNTNGEFFLKKNGVFLLIILIVSIFYSLLIFNIQFVFLLSVIFSMCYAFLGYYVGFDNQLNIFGYRV